MRGRRWVLVMAVSLPALGACSGPTAIDPETAAFFQEQVRALATLTRDGELDRALEQAAALRADVQEATDAGNVSPGRADRIQANIDSFVESLQATEPTPEPPATTPAPPPVQSPTDISEDAEDAARDAEERAEEEAERAEEEAEEREDD